MENEEIIAITAKDILDAKGKSASCILTFGADLIPNGLTEAVGKLIEEKFITHLATTGAALIDDFEVARGAAASLKDDLRLINMAIAVGSFKGYGMGESVAKVISSGRLEIPSGEELDAVLESDAAPADLSAAAELRSKLPVYGTGTIEIDFPGREESLMYVAEKASVPFTIHPQFGLDDYFVDPGCSFAAVGRTAESDFLCFVNSVYNLEEGVYLSVGSSVASPMIFEKALSMSQNVRIQRGCRMTGHKLVIVDLAESRWDWMKNGEPPETRPEYYLRYCKSFSRAAAKSMYYVSADNREFFYHLMRELDIK